jgi:CRP/FNR family transcriptional regulator
MLDLKNIQWANEVLRGLDFFAHCSDEDIVTLVEHLENNVYKQGGTILFQGEISNRFFIVHQGTVGVYKSVQGQKNRVALLEAGKYFGEISLMTPTSATATVKAETAVEIFSLAYEHMEFVFRKDPEALKRIQQKIEERRIEMSSVSAVPAVPPAPKP